MHTVRTWHMTVLTITSHPRFPQPGVLSTISWAPLSLCAPSLTVLYIWLNSTLALLIRLTHLIKWTKSISRRWNFFSVLEEAPEAGLTYNMHTTYTASGESGGKEEITKPLTWSSPVQRLYPHLSLLHLLPLFCTHLRNPVGHNTVYILNIHTRV